MNKRRKTAREKAMKRARKLRGYRRTERRILIVLKTTILVAGIIISMLLAQVVCLKKQIKEVNIKGEKIVENSLYEEIPQMQEVQPESTVVQLTYKSSDKQKVSNMVLVKVKNEETKQPAKSQTSKVITKNATDPVVVKLNTSAYCACEICCGKTDGITASGRKAKPWHTVAAGRKYPIGTIIYIPALANMPNNGWFEVEDRGGAISDEKLDIYFESHEEAIKYGRKTLEAYIYSKRTNS